MINIEVYSTHAVIRSQQPLTVGLTGASAHFAFGKPWDQLIKTAVFRQGEKTVTVADIGQQVELPWEVLTLPGVPVMIGVYGTDPEGKLVIPTLWAETEPVRPGADPQDGVTPAEPTAPVWAQLQSNMGSREQLNTNDKTSLVAAINEANRAVLSVTVSGSDGSYETRITMAELSAAFAAGKSPLCYWEEHGVWLPLAKLDVRQTGMSFANFSLSAKNKEYYIHMTSVSGGDMKVTGSVTVLATEKSKLPNPEKLTLIGKTTAEYDGSEAVSVDIPTKVSDLEDAGDYLTEAPVTSVNGLNGDVSTATKVSLTEQTDGSYLSDLSSAEIMAAYRDHKSVHCYHNKMILPLIRSVVNDAVFSGIYDGQIHTVNVASNRVATVTVIPLSSGGGGSGEPGEDGGYYIPNVSQVDENTMSVSFAASKEGMADVADQEITLPSGKNGADGKPGADGKDGSPGVDGKNGSDGITPHIGANGNWWIGEEDTGVSAGVTDEQISGAVEAYMEENPLVKTVNGTAPDENGNVELELPSGGGSSEGGAFRISLVLTEDIVKVVLKMPVKWGKIVQYNLNCVPKLSGNAKVEMFNGESNYKVIGDLSSNTKAFNIYGIQYWHDMFSQPFFTFGLAVAGNAEDTARPMIPTASMAVDPNLDEITIYTVGGAAVFQAGTKFEMWGVYTP